MAPRALTKSLSLSKGALNAGGKTQVERSGQRSGHHSLPFSLSARASALPASFSPLCQLTSFLKKKCSEQVLAHSLLPASRTLHLQPVNSQKKL